MQNRELRTFIETAQQNVIHFIEIALQHDLFEIKLKTYPCSLVTVACFFFTGCGISEASKAIQTTWFSR